MSTEDEPTTPAPERPHQDTRPDRSTTKDLRRAQAVGVTIALLGIAAFMSTDSGYVSVSDGPAPATHELTGTTAPSGDGAFHVTTIAATPLNKFQRRTCSITGDCDMIKLDTGLEDTTTQMDQSLHDAQHLGDEIAEKFTTATPAQEWTSTTTIGGPSAGLALTLARIDERLPGDLTGGHHIAVTGTIDPDGTVGQVGGVAHKAAGARKAGATHMLVPRGEGADARRGAPDLTVVEVTDVKDALTWLCDNDAQTAICD